MSKEKLFSELKVEDIISSAKTNEIISLNYWECTGYGNIVRGVREHPHMYYYISIGGVRYTDDGKCRNLRAFANAVRDKIKEFENVLSKNHIIVVTSHNNWDNYDYISDLVKLIPSKSFIALQAWLDKKANFKLSPLDLYWCDVCKKRESKSYSNFQFLAKDENKCANLLNKIKSNYKNGNKVVVKIEEDEYIDQSYCNFESEQYGTSNKHLIVIISTKTGRNERKIYQ